MKYQWIKGPIILTIIIVLAILFARIIEKIPKELTEDGMLYVGLLFMSSVFVIVILQLIGMFKKPKR